MLRVVFLCVILCFSVAFSAEKPDRLILAIGGESAEGYDPATGWGRYGHPLFHSTLLTYDDGMRLTGDLAVSHELSTDRLTWTIRIRDDAVFSDGTLLTADDVAFTFTQAAASAGVVDLSVMREAVATGSHEVEIRLKRPEITFVNHLLTLGIIPRHGYGPDYARRPVGSGPYRMVEWQEGQQLIVEANPHYYGDKPEFERVVFLFVNDDTALAAARAGRVHVVSVPQAFARRDIRGMRLVPVRSVDNRGVMFPMLPEQAARSKQGHVIGNTVTADLAIRQAVNYAADRRELVDGILYGHGEPAFGMVDGLPWDNPEIRFADNDVDKAKQILADAGWKDTDGDGVVEKNGLAARIPLVYPASDLTRQNLALALRDQVLRAGIELQPQGVSWDAIYARYSFNSAVLYGWGDTSPLELYRIYHSREYDDDTDTTSFNTGRYANPAVDGYLDAAQAAPGLQESLPLWRKAQWDGVTGPAVQGDAAWAWLVNLTHTYYVDDSLDIGVPAIEPHGHGWPITRGITRWKWKPAP